MWKVILAVFVACEGFVVAQADEGAAVRDVMAPYVENGDIPGLVSVLIDGDRDVVESIGWADAERKVPMSTNRMYMVCSQTKGVCGVAAAILIEEGRLRLDDPVERYLPRFSDMRVEEVMPDRTWRLRKASRKMTIRNLLTHTSGLPFESPSKREFGATGVPLAVAAAEAAVQPLIADPGKKFSYSNWGMDVAARIVEIVSKKGFDVFLKERVFAPLGMKDTTFNPSDEQLSRAMRLYRVAPGMKCERIADTPIMPLPRNGPTVFPGAGAGLWTTPADFTEFYRMLLNRGIGRNGARILKESTVRELLEKSQIPEETDTKKGYSLGLHVDGNGWYGHGGAYHTNCRMNPVKRQMKFVAQQLEGDEPPDWPWRVAWDEACAKYLKGSDGGKGNEFVGLKSAQAGLPAYKDRSQPIELRVADLISRMTPEEKCAQLGLVMGGDAYERGDDGKLHVRETFATEYLQRPVGQIYGLFRADPWTKKDWTNGVRPEEAADLARAVQRLAVERTRLGIPVFLVAEAPHGLMELGMPVYPFGMALGSTFDTDLMRRIGAAKGASAFARGERTIYAPIVDIARDPRWSRFEECFGELPEHVAQMALAEFQGLMSSGVDSCMKHFICAGGADGGQHTASVRVGDNEFQNVWLRPFRRLLAAGARELMCTYNVVDGEHSSTSPYLLGDVLRGQLGYRGFVNGDAGSIQMAASERMCKDVDHAAARALKAGCDTEFDLGNVRGGDLYLGAYRKGLVTDGDLDRSLRRVLTLKFEMGLFENPYAPEGDLSYIAREKELVLEAARKAITLLKNDDTLPLCSPRRIAVIGPQAGDRVMNQLGDYTAVQRREDVATVRDGIRQFAGKGVRVDYALGCRIRKVDRSGFAAAEKLASESDVTIFCMGGASSRYGVQTLKDEWAGAAVASPKGDPESDRDSGEGMDKADIRYSGVQMELFRALRAKAKKLVVVLVQGRPAVVDELLDEADAVLLAWYPGSRGGEAVAETLFGLNNPSGRLPVTFPRGSQYLPSLDQMPSHRPFYVDGDPNPRLKVGYGLSYTRFAYSPLRVEPRADGGLAAHLSVEVTNIGKVAGDHSVLFFATLRDTDIERPARELVGFARVSLRPGESKTVEVDVTREVLGRYDRNGRFVPHLGSVDYSL